MPTETLLEQLRDIHTPLEPGIWPLSLAWWVLVAVLVCGLTVSIWWFIRSFHQLYPYLRVRRRARLLTKQFAEQNLSFSAYVCSINLLYKQLFAQIENERAVITMFGSSWLQFLCHRFDDERFISELGQSLGLDQYHRNAKTNGEGLRELVESTLFQVKPKRVSRA